MSKRENFNPAATRMARIIVRGGRLLCSIAAGLGAYALFPRHRVDAWSRARWLQRVAARCLRALHVKIETRGALPTTGVVFAPNHLGYLDILVLASISPTVFVAKREVRGWTVFGRCAHSAGTVFIDRGNRADTVRVGAELAAIRATRVNLVLFLEGTSTDGRDVRPFKSSLLEPAAAGGWPVAPVALAYATPSPAAVETAICWWGDMKLIPHLLGLLALPQVTAKIFFGEARPASSDRKELAKGLQKQVLHMKDLLNTAVSDHDTLSVGETYAKVYHASDR